MEKGSHFTLLYFTICRKNGREKNYVIHVYSFRNYIATSILRYSSVLSLELTHVSKNMS